VLASVVHELVGADEIVLGHDGPVVGVAVDAGDLIGWKLKDLESDLGPIKGQGRKTNECDDSNDETKNNMVFHWRTHACIEV
jgi:hypothetical protein